jgi:hypothetical protein
LEALLAQILQLALAHLPLSYAASLNLFEDLVRRAAKHLLVDPTSFPTFTNPKLFTSIFALTQYPPARPAPLPPR